MTRPSPQHPAHSSSRVARGIAGGATSSPSRQRIKPLSGGVLGKTAPEAPRGDALYGGAEAHLLNAAGLRPSLARKSSDGAPFRTPAKMRKDTARPAFNLSAALPMASALLRCSSVVEQRDWERFWAKVDVRDGADECWEWQAAVSQNGYGAFGLDGRVIGAHCVAYMIANGDAPSGTVIMHDCDNPLCCNPAHLTAGTQAKNMGDCSERGRLHLGGPGSGMANHQAKMDWEKVREARALLGDGASLRSVARRFGVSHSTMAAIRDNRTWKV